jgi:hypothetical protein
MSPHQQEKLLIEAYLKSQVREFSEGKKRIFTSLNLGYSFLIDSFLNGLLRYIWIYYPEYLRGTLTKKQLAAFFKKEIRVHLLRTKLAAHLHDQTPKGLAQLRVQIETLYSYALPVFANFQDSDELVNILNSARRLAQERDICAPAVFINGAYYNELMRRLYPDREKLSEKIKNTLTIFSLEKILEHFIAPASDLYNLADEKAEAFLAEQRKRLAASPERHARLREFQIAVETVIANRVKEIHGTTA